MPPWHFDRVFGQNAVSQVGNYLSLQQNGLLTWIDIELE